MGLRAAAAALRRRPREDQLPELPLGGQRPEGLPDQPPGSQPLGRRLKNCLMVLPFEVADQAGKV
jgi:hypothetical protein